MLEVEKAKTEKGARAIFAMVAAKRHESKNSCSTCPRFQLGGLREASRQTNGRSVYFLQWKKIKQALRRPKCCVINDRPYEKMLERCGLDESKERSNNNYSRLTAVTSECAFHKKIAVGLLKLSSLSLESCRNLFYNPFMVEVF